MNNEEYLIHFNPNHDPRNGRFAKSSSGTSTSEKRKLTLNGVSDRIKGMTVGQKAATAAGAMALVSAGATFVNYQTTNGFLDRMGESVRISALYATHAGVVKAGKVAATAGLAVIGGHMISDYMKQTKSSNKR